MKAGEILIHLTQLQYIIFMMSTFFFLSTYKRHKYKCDAPLHQALTFRIGADFDYSHVRTMCGN